ncbi:flagellin [Ectobacillus polymachus]|uniref:flagellin N-terminal helical domain-containing protein n=1 Tax=Ectobacillus polymachus TaxID=1508806 RepID=UPI003A8BA70E
MIINHNIAAMNTLRYLNGNSEAQAKSMERLSSGLRINRGADDAAGLSISEKMRAQIKGLDQASRNAQDGVSMIQTADGALNETTSILQRMRELTVQSSSDTLAAPDRQAIGNEMVALRDQVDTIAKTTSFNGKNLLDGTLATKEDGATSTLKTGALATATDVNVTSIDVSAAKGGDTFTFSTSGTDITLTSTLTGATQKIQLSDTMFAAGNASNVLNFDQLGVKVTLNGGGGAVDTAANVATDLTKAGSNTLKTLATNAPAQLSVGSDGTAQETIKVAFGDMSAKALDSNLDSTKLDANTLSDVKTAQQYTGYVDNAIAAVSAQRSAIGAVQNRLEHTINSLDTVSQNTSTAESRIRDVDMAKEVMNSSKSGILAQAAQAMLAQANQQPQGVLQLLR